MIDAPLADGEGGFGKVFEAEGEDGTAAVAKFVRKEPGAQRELLIGDPNAASEFRNVVPILDRGEHEESWVLVMPRADMSLAQHLDQADAPLPLDEALTILTDIATALTDIDGEIVHRDLKPQNILYLNGKWCLADFGIARYAEAATASDTRKDSLTAPYGAPEQWRAERATSATDVYAFGIIAFQLLSGKLPFEGPTRADFREQHLKATPPPLASATARLRHLIEECLYKAPAARPTAANILAKLGNAAADPSTPGQSRLAQVSQDEVRRIAKTQAQELRNMEEAERRAEMFAAAKLSFETLSQSLLSAITDNAPTAAVETRRGKIDLLATLREATLGVFSPQQVSRWQGPFDVIAYAEVSVYHHRPNRQGWRGRSHSLWFCDAEVQGHYAWYETAFMDNSLIPIRRMVAPYACSPEEATGAFQTAIGTMQRAWPLERLNREDLTDFVDRWIGWFADAAQGTFGRPSRMPEKDVGSHRR